MENKREMGERNLLKTLKNVFSGNILTLMWTRLIFYFITRLYQDFFPFYIQALGGSSAEIGLVSSMAAFASLIIVPISGYLADHIGRVKLIVTAFLFRSATFLIYAFSTNWVMLAFGNFYHGLSMYFQAAQSALIADSLPPGRRAMGFATLNSLPQIVAIGAPTVGAYMITLYGIDLGMRYIFIIVFFGMLAISVGRQVGLKETLKDTKSVSELKASFGGVRPLIKEAYKSSFSTLKWTPKSLAGFVVIECLASFAGAMVGPFWGIYAKEIVNLSIADWATIITMNSILLLVLSVPAGLIIDKIGNRKTIIAMLILSIFNGFLFTQSTSFMQTLAVMLYITFISAFISPAAHAFVADIVPREIRARITSAYGRGSIGIIGGVGGAGGGYVVAIPSLIGSIVGGVIYSFNPTYPWLIQTGFLAICFILGTLLLKETETPEVWAS